MPKLALVAMLASFLASSAQDEPTAKFGVTVVVPFGLEGKVYHISDLSERLPNFRKMKPKGTIYTPFIYVPPMHFRQGFPGVTKRFEWFAIEYTGRFWVRKPGPYRWVLTSDDGSQLFIDDQLVIDNDGIHPPVAKDATIVMTPGPHSLRVGYFQGPRDMLALMLQVAPPGEGLQIFSTDEFRPPAEQIETAPAPEKNEKKQP